MTSGIKGILWLAFIIVLFAGSQKVKADPVEELEAIMADKTPRMRGECTVDREGRLTRAADGVYEVSCRSAFNEGEPEIHYVVIYDLQGEADRLIMLNVITFDQGIIWRRGREL